MWSNDKNKIHIPVFKYVAEVWYRRIYHNRTRQDTGNAAQREERHEKGAPVKTGAFGIYLLNLLQKYNNPPTTKTWGAYCKNTIAKIQNQSMVIVKLQ